jgi:hydrogenase expression/formation protein HypC
MLEEAWIELCLGVPAEVLEVRRDSELTVLKVRMGGVIREVLTALPDVSPGEYVIVHAGIAISKIDEKELEELTNILRELEEESIQ